jgi:hypothetical protein
MKPTETEKPVCKHVFGAGNVCGMPEESHKWTHHKFEPVAEPAELDANDITNPAHCVSRAADEIGWGKTVSAEPTAEQRIRVVDYDDKDVPVWERPAPQPVARIPVCYKAGIAPYPCDSPPKLREGNWLCDEHYFQAQQKRKMIAQPVAGEGTRFCKFCGDHTHKSENHPRTPGPFAPPMWCEYCHGHYMGDFLQHETNCTKPAPKLAEGTPKLEEIAHQLAETVLLTHREPNESIFDYQPRVETSIAAILRPFFTPACSSEKE